MKSIQSCAACFHHKTRVSCFALLVIGALTVLVSQTVRAQTFTVLHTFTGGGDGWVLSPG